MTSVGGWQTIFGQAVRSRRLDLELTLEEASAAAGVSRSHFNLIELGKATGISRDCAVRIDAGLGSEGALLALVPVSAAKKDPAQVATRGEEMRRAEFNKPCSPSPLHFTRIGDARDEALGRPGRAERKHAAP